MGALIPVLVSLLPGIIKGVENIFGAKTGKTKAEAAFEAAVSALQTILSKPGVPADMKTISDDGIKALIDFIVNQMNASGELPKPAEAVAGAKYVVQVIGKA